MWQRKKLGVSFCKSLKAPCLLVDVDFTPFWRTKTCIGLQEPLFLDEPKSIVVSLLNTHNKPVSLTVRPSFNVTYILR